MNTPNWDIWDLIPTLKLWEAIALSMDVNPSLISCIDADNQQEHFSEVLLRNLDRFEFKKRQKVTEANLQSAIRTLHFDKRNIIESVVFLESFASFVAKTNWQCPRRFSVRVEPPTSKDEALPTSDSLQQIAKAQPNQKKWDNEALRRLHHESLLPGMTQKCLAEKYDVTRQRIGKLLKQAEEIVVRRAGPFDAIGVKHSRARKKLY